eukprot:366546-Chlamydomonas_euryale.AAC.49
MSHRSRRLHGGGFAHTPLPPDREWRREWRASLRGARARPPAAPQPPGRHDVALERGETHELGTGLWRAIAYTRAERRNRDSRPWKAGPKADLEAVAGYVSVGNGWRRAPHGWPTNGACLPRSPLCPRLWPRAYVRGGKWPTGKSGTTTRAHRIDSSTRSRGCSEDGPTTVQLPPCMHTTLATLLMLGNAVIHDNVPNSAPSWQLAFPAPAVRWSTQGGSEQLLIARIVACWAL